MQQQKFCFEEKAKKFDALLCHCECFMRGILGFQTIYLLSVDFGVVSICCSSLAWQPAPTPNGTRCSSYQHPGQGSACGSFGSCRLPSMLPLHSPAAMHYQGRAEDGSRNLVSLPVFCLLGKCSAAQGCCKWGCDMSLMTLFLGSLQRKKLFFPCI